MTPATSPLSRPPGWVYCTPCAQVIGHAPTLRQRRDLLYTHHDRLHLGQQTEIRQLDTVTWREQFLNAVRALPVGLEFTTADLHGRIPDPPHPNHWGKATADAAHLGLCRAVDVQRSTLESTKGSRLLRWVRVDEKAVAA